MRARTRLILGAACMAVFASHAAEVVPASIGITVGALDNPFYQALVRGAMQTARGLNPEVQITTLSASFNLANQERQIQQLIEQKVDLILLGAVDSKAVEPLVRKAQQAGIKVVAVDVDAPGADGTVKSDNRQAGELACRYLADKMHEKGGFIIQSGPPVSSVTDRVAGCRKALEAYPGIWVLSDNEDGQASSWGGRKLMAEHLKRFPGVSAVFAINDRQALGVEQALRDAARRNVLVASVDGSPDIEAALHRSGPIVASAGQLPLMIGSEAVKLGQKLLQNGSHPQRSVVVPVQLITRENLASYQGWLSRPTALPAR